MLTTTGHGLAMLVFGAGLLLTLGSVLSDWKETMPIDDVQWLVSTVVSMGVNALPSRCNLLMSRAETPAKGRAYTYHSETVTSSPESQSILCAHIGI